MYEGWYYLNFPSEPIESISHMTTADAKRRHLFARSNIPSPLGQSLVTKPNTWHAYRVLDETTR